MAITAGEPIVEELPTQDTASWAPDIQLDCPICAGKHDTDLRYGELWKPRRLELLWQPIVIDGLIRIRQQRRRDVRLPEVDPVEWRVESILPWTIGEAYCIQWEPKDAERSYKLFPWWRDEFGDPYEWSPASWSRLSEFHIRKAVVADWLCDLNLLVGEGYLFDRRRFRPEYLETTSTMLVGNIGLPVIRLIRIWQIRRLAAAAVFAAAAPPDPADGLGRSDNPTNMQLAQWDRKYACHKKGCDCTRHNSQTDPNLARFRNFWRDTKTPPQAKVTNYFQQNLGWDSYEVPKVARPKPSPWMQASQVEDDFLRIAKEAPPKLFLPIVPEIAPYHQPNLDCFCEPSITVPGVPGGNGGCGAKPANRHVGLAKIENFKPAELPAESVQQFWEDRLNAIGQQEQEAAKAKFEGDPHSPYAPHWEARSIWPQDHHGNLTGTRFSERRTTVLAKRQEELDARMARVLAFRQSKLGKKIIKLKQGGATEEELIAVVKQENRPDVILMLMSMGLTGQDAAIRSGKKRNSMNQANKRDKLKRKDPVISEAVRNTAPQEEGWYQVVKLKSCSPYLVKLDLPLEPSDEEYDFAIWTAKWGEHQRLLVNKLKDVGWNKVTTDGNELNEDGLKILGESRDRVFEAFDKGMVIHLNQEFIKKYA